MLYTQSCTINFIKDNIMNKKIILLSAFALSLSMSQVVLACGCKTTYESGDRYVQMAEKLDLTAEQKTKIQAISDKAREDMKPKFDEMRSIRMQLNEQAAAKEVDEAKIDKLIDQKKELLGSIMKTRVMVRHDIDMVLTDAQKAKMNKMMAEWKAKHMKND